MGFPTGVSVNHIAAHYTPNPHDTRCLHYGDVLKLDFGAQVNGYIIDSAFTVAFHPQFDPLIQATREATYAGIRESGLGARVGEIGGVIEEVINSFEVTIDGRTYPSIFYYYYLLSSINHFFNQSSINLQSSIITYFITSSYSYS